MKISETIFKALNGNWEAAIKMGRHHIKKRNSSGAIVFATIAARIADNYANRIDTAKYEKNKFWNETIKLLQDIRKVSLQRG